MKLLCRFSLVATMLAAGACAAFGSDEQPFFLHQGDTVVFYGDSITDQRLYTMITEFYTVTRYPKLGVTFVHSGWGGDRVSGGGGGPIDLRLQRDVFAYKPTVITVMLGMNDGRYTNHTPADDDTYFKGYEHLVDSLRKNLPNVRVTLIEPSPFDDVTRPLTLQPGGYNAVLVKYSEWIRHYVSDNHLTDADFNGPVVAMLKAANSADPEVAQKIIPDRVHPGFAGHLIMAEQLLKSWNARPVVSAVALDAASGKVTQSDFTRVTDFHTGDQIAWQQTDEALPFPLADLLANDRDHSLSLAVRSSDVTQALDEEPLKISGLKPGKYKLTIDGQEAGAWSDSDLAAGVNLATVETPMSKQAMEVRDLTVQHLDIHQSRWRTLQVPLQDWGLSNLDATLKALDSIEQEVVKRQRAAAQPRPHAYQLVPVT